MLHEKLLSAHMLSFAALSRLDYFLLAAAVGFFCGFHFCRVHLGGWLAINFFFLVKAVVVRWLCLSKLSMWQAVCNLVLLLSFDRRFFFPKLFLYEVHVQQ